MKKRLKGLFALILALIFTCINIIDVSAYFVPGGVEPPPVIMVPFITRINVVKLKVDNLPENKIPIDKSKIGEYLGTEKIRNMIQTKYPDVGEVKELSGAKFYCFKVIGEKNFNKMYKNPEKYDSVEKILENVKKGEVSPVFYASKPKIVTEDYGVTDTGEGQEVFKYDEYIDEDTKKEDIKSYLYTKDEDVRKGIATFPMLTTVIEGQPEYCWIVEDSIDTSNELADIEGSKAVPIGLLLPMRKYENNSFSGDFLEDIYVYPKNTIGNIITKEKTVESENAKYVSIDNYQGVDWYLQANIPENDFEKLTYLRFEDTVDSEAPASKITVETQEDNKKPDNNFDRGFIFDDLDNIEVYVKKFNALTDEEENRKVKIDKKYYSTDGSNNKKIVVNFNSREVDGKTVLDINNPKLNGGKHPIYNEDKEVDKNGQQKRTGFDKKDKLTVFVKVHSRYSALGGTEGNKKYISEKDFDNDIKNDATGINDVDLNKLRVNDFKLTYSHNPNVLMGAKTKEAPGNKYKPRVDTGGIKFIKYVINDKTKAEGLEGTKFLVGRSSEANYNGKSGTKSDYEYDALMSQMGRSTEGKTGRQYLALKDNRKIWLEEKELNKAYDTYKKRREEALKQGKPKNEIDKIKIEVSDGKNKGAKFYVLESEKNGLFEIRGLERSDYKIKMLKYTGKDKKPEVSKAVHIKNNYWLTEISAPEGYQIDQNDINFEIKDDSHIGKIECKKLSLDEIDKDSFPKGSDISKIVSQRYAIQNVKPIIPNTGGIGRLMFILTGLSVMAGSIIVRRKRKKRLCDNAE